MTHLYIVQQYGPELCEQSVHNDREDAERHYKFQSLIPPIGSRDWRAFSSNSPSNSGYAQPGNLLFV